MSSGFGPTARSARQIDEVDAVSEADIYIAYGRYRQAEGLLREEMQRMPDRVDLKYKLADAYFATKDHQALRGLMDQMQASGDDRVSPDQWQRLVDMVAATQVEQPSASAVSASEPVSEVVSDALDLASGDRESTHSPVDLGGNADLDDSHRSPFDRSSTLQSASVVGPRSSLPMLEDLAFDRAKGPDTHSHGHGFGDVSSHDFGTELSGGVSDLELTIDDLRAAADLDLDSFTDSTRTLSTLVDDPTHMPSERPFTRLRTSDLGTLEGEALSESRELELSGIPADPEGPASSDPLSSQWHMDSRVWDETATKLDLARAYFEMGDGDSAQGILEEVIAEGTEQQRSEARELLRALG